MKILKLKKGIGGLLFILVTAISTLTLSVVIELSTYNNIKYMVNSTAYFVANKSAVNLYNTGSESGTYSSIPRILKENYSPAQEMNSMLSKSYENRITSYCDHVSVQWNKETKTAVVSFGSVSSGKYTDIFPHDQKIIIER